MADLRVAHPRFQTKNLAVRLPGAFRGALLVLDGQPVPRVKGSHSVVDDAGRTAIVKLKGSFDPIPKVDLDGEIISIARALAWYEYAWAAWPFGLVAVGGAIGGAVGGLAAMVNLRLMRAEMPPAGRYAVTAAVGVTSVVLYAIVASLFLGAVGQMR